MPSPSKKSARSGAMHSRVGGPQVYADSDQRDDQSKPHHNYMDLEDKSEREIGEQLSAAHKQSQVDERPTAATYGPEGASGGGHFRGHEPSAGFLIDEQLKREDQEELKRKGKLPGNDQN
ncbi:hypothetical protein BJ138DRAFT_1179415 [Hygrophoropsis aurantiaca]|uniref:Uncharacterized protein n=1 Tax=Hygrophoropsis aurantiaca TaxID=72124 RepID=A0ACB8AEP7_9AGAM|nr:hypothetical protein BJ138DRAFT_1179415 [Hygrophoropsis aurantiaca]